MGLGEAQAVTHCAKLSVSFGQHRLLDSKSSFMNEQSCQHASQIQFGPDALTSQPGDGSAPLPHSPGLWRGLWHSDPPAHPPGAL